MPTQVEVRSRTYEVDELGRTWFRGARVEHPRVLREIRRRLRGKRVEAARERAQREALERAIEGVRQKLLAELREAPVPEKRRLPWLRRLFRGR